MGTLYLVRHGQASFGADDYDQLSDLGRRQSVRLGEYFAQKQIHFDGLIAGTLRRHRQTLEGILEGMNRAGEHLSWDGLNEYDSAAVIAAIHPQKLEKPGSPEQYRHHFRLLRDGLAQWMAGVVSPKGMPTYDDFVAGVAGALDHVRANHYGQTVLQRRAHFHRSGPRTRNQPGDHHRPEHADSQHRDHAVRLHAEAPFAGELQRHTAS
jgi:broad specificity phosphatase PhoE